MPPAPTSIEPAKMVVLIWHFGQRPNPPSYNEPDDMSNAMSQEYHC